MKYDGIERVAAIHGLGYGSTSVRNLLERYDPSNLLIIDRWMLARSDEDIALMLAGTEGERLRQLCKVAPSNTTQLLNEIKKLT